jgi:hypothetical protein
VTEGPLSSSSVSTEERAIRSIRGLTRGASGHRRVAAGWGTGPSPLHAPSSHPRGLVVDAHRLQSGQARRPGLLAGRPRLRSAVSQRRLHPAAHSVRAVERARREGRCGQHSVEVASVADRRLLSIRRRRPGLRSREIGHHEGVFEAQGGLEPQATGLGGGLRQGLMGAGSRLMPTALRQRLCGRLAGTRRRIISRLLAEGGFEPYCARIEDITPTQLQLLGQSVPSYMEGRVLSEMLPGSAAVPARGGSGRNCRHRCAVHRLASSGG